MGRIGLDPDRTACFTVVSLDLVRQQGPEFSSLLAVAQAKENAILDLIREKMTSADQATFDQLRAAATEEQAALQQAQTDLSDTTAKIDLLVDTYLGISTSSTSTSTSDSTSGSGSTTFGSIM